MCFLFRSLVLFFIFPGRLLLSAPSPVLPQSLPPFLAPFPFLLQNKTSRNGGANPLRTRPQIILAASAARRGVRPFDEVRTTPHLVGLARSFCFCFFFLARIDSPCSCLWVSDVDRFPSLRPATVRVRSGFRLFCRRAVALDRGVVVDGWCGRWTLGLAYGVEIPLILENG
jgi:hypothetical protein